MRILSMRIVTALAVGGFLLGSGAFQAQALPSRVAGHATQRANSAVVLVHDRDEGDAHTWQRHHRHFDRDGSYAVVEAPFTRVEHGRRVVVDAPFAHVYVSREGHHIVAPFVDLRIAR